MSDINREYMKILFGDIDKPEFNEALRNVVDKVKKKVREEVIKEVISLIKQHNKTSDLVDYTLIPYLKEKVEKEVVE